MTNHLVIGTGHVGDPILQALMHIDEISVESINSSNKNSLQEKALKAECIWIAVRPKDFAEVMTELEKVVTKETVLVSCVAGQTLDEYKHLQIIRIMPSIFLKMGSGVILTTNKSASQAKFIVVKQLLRLMCRFLYVVPEAKLHVGTIFVGSMPAILAYILDAVKFEGSTMILPRSVHQGISELGIEEGFTEGQMENIYNETLRGIVEAYRSGISLSVIIESVKTPDGCTEKALQEFTQTNLPNILKVGDLSQQKSTLKAGLTVGIEHFGYLKVA